MFDNPLFWLAVVVVLAFLYFRRRRENTPYDGAEPLRMREPEEGVVRVSKSDSNTTPHGHILDPGSHSNPRGEIVSKPGSLRIPTVASAEREADRKRRSDSSGGDDIVLMKSSPYTGTKTTKAVDTDSDGSKPAGTSGTKDTGGTGSKDTGNADCGDGDSGGGCGD
ncbi:MAG: hypothetical protein EON60_04135 [Alphaproteobacteria bacterium]|nr:MAG: hypothetical protein EON60_04135 [Alphaproteobacteria bacterium]